MLRSLFISLIFLSFIAMGAAAPFVFSLGYVWVDTFRPQEIASLVLPSIPVSMVMGALAIGSYIVADRRSPAPVETIATRRRPARLISPITAITRP